MVIVVNVQPLQAAYAGPNYSLRVADDFYEVYVDKSGVEDFRIQFLTGKRMEGWTRSSTPGRARACSRRRP